MNGVEKSEKDLTYEDIIIAINNALKQISERFIKDFDITLQIVMKVSKTGIDATFVFNKGEMPSKDEKDFDERLKNLTKKIIEEIGKLKERIEKAIDYLNKLVISIGFEIWGVEISATLTLERPKPKPKPKPT